MQRFSLNFAANIIAAVLMLLGSVRAFDWVKPSFMQFFCFLSSALGVNVLFAWLSSDAGSTFNEQGLIGYLVWPVIILVAGVILAKRTQNEALTFIPVVLWLTADTLLMAVQSVIQFLGTQNWLPNAVYGYVPLVFVLLFVWQTASLLFVFAKKLHWRLWERVLMLVGAISLLFVWQKNTLDQPIFKTAEVVPTLSEEDFYVQPMLLSQALDGVSVGKLGVSEWYFLGAAGDASQEVFAHEIDTARQLFDVRFGTDGRSVALINSPYSWQNAPIASRTSIAAALKAIGAKMNIEEDVLFFLVSSHGLVDEQHIPTGEVLLNNPPLSLDALDGKWLRQALDASGVRWRVLVVSACYSGAFIKELETPNTVVITASAADRASFGCTNDATLTYFGQAFFEESLRSQTSFENAFVNTVRRVSEREALMGFEPSNPQMVVGSLMKTALPEFEKVLFGYGLTPKPAPQKSP